MRSSAGVGAIASIVFGVAGLVWMALELAPQPLGFEDTDSPAMGLAFLRGNAIVYVQIGLALFLMAITLAITALAAWDALEGRSNSLGLRLTSAAGLLAATCFFLFGVLRFGVYPLLYLDSLDPDWGEATYLVVQMAGIHGFAQAAIVTSSAWAVGIAVLGARAHVLPRWLAVLSVLPGIRLLAIAGPLGLLPEGSWIFFMLAIPGSMVWFILLGAVLLRRTRRGPAELTAAAAAEVASA